MSRGARVRRVVAVVLAAGGSAAALVPAACSLDRNGLGPIVLPGDSGAPRDAPSLPPRDAPPPVDACSPDLTRDPKNCGECGKVCAASPNENATCVASICGMQCAPGFSDCDGNTENGCEAATSSDPMNCGVCGHACGGGACANSACQPTALATGQESPVGLVVDDTYVFWTVRGAAAGTGEVLRAKLDGSSTTVLIGGRSSPGLLAATPTTLFWTDVGSAAAGYADGDVESMGKDGTCGEVGPCPFVLATTPDFRSTNPDPAVGQPFALALSGDGTHVGVTILPSDIVWLGTSGQTDLGFGTPGVARPTGIATVGDGGAVVATVSGVGIVDTLANGATTILASDAGGPLGLVVDDAGAYAYVAMNGSGTLAAVALDGGGFTSFAASLDHPAYVALDGDTVYFTAQGTSGMSDGYVGKVSKDGTCPAAWGAECPAILANGQGLPGALAVDASYVYWVDTEGGAVLKVAK